MPVLTHGEYNEYYFDGGSHSLSHNAGYTYYRRWFRNDPGNFPESSGGDGANNFGDMASALHGRFNINSKVLILGSAKGYIVHDLRNLGVEAYGIDVSQYAYDQADPEVQPYLTVTDALTYLKTLKQNSMTYIFSRWLLCCIADADIPELVAEMNRVSRNQVHIIMRYPNPLYYTVHTTQEWLDLFDWDVGTILVPSQDWTGYLRK